MINKTISLISKVFLLTICLVSVSFSTVTENDNLLTSKSKVDANIFLKNKNSQPSVESLLSVDYNFNFLESFKSVLPISTCIENTIETVNTEAVFSFDNITDDEDGTNNPDITSSIIFDTDNIAGGSSLVFDGTTEMGFQPSSTADTFGRAFRNLSVGFWIKPDTAIPTTNEILYEEGGAGVGFVIYREVTTGNIVTRIRNGANSVQIANFPYPADNDWHHIAFTFNNGRGVTYLDGEIGGDVTVSTTLMPAHTNASGFGGIYGGLHAAIDVVTAFSGYEGKMDEAFYSYNTIRGGQILQYIQCLKGSAIGDSNPILCPDVAFQTNNGEYYSIDLASGETIQQTVTNTVFTNTFAAGFNENDGLIYSLTFDQITITEIEETAPKTYEFTNHKAGPVVGLPPGVDYAAGDVYDNKLYVKTTSPFIYEIDIDNTSPTYLTVTNTIPLSNNITTTRDFVISDGILYAVAEDGNAYTINLNTGNVTSLRRAFGAAPPLAGMFMDGEGLIYAINNTTGIIYRLDLSEAFPNTVEFSNTITMGANDGIFCKNNIFNFDFGDAPDSYGTILVNSGKGGPRHLITNYDAVNYTSNLNLGATIDRETNGFVGLASGDNNDETVDEDALTTIQDIDINGTTHTITIPYVNNTGSDATIYAWIDFDRNGTFDDNEEFTSVTASSGATSAILNWTFPADITSGNTYMRFRITSDVLTDSTSGNTDDRALGFASNGEVEDYAVRIDSGGNISDCLTDFIGVGNTEAIYSFDNTTNDENGTNNPDTTTSITFDSDNIAGGNSIVFDGTSEMSFQNTAVTETYAAAFANLSVGFWIKPDSNTPTTNEVLYEEGGGNVGFIIYREVTTGNIVVRIRNGLASVQIANFVYPTDNEWHHIAFTFQNGRSYTYLDGEISGGGTVSTTTMPAHLNDSGFGGIAGASHIASDFSTNFGGYRGKMDEAFYSYNTIRGGQILQYVQCFSVNRFSSSSLCFSKAFQSTNGAWTSINLFTGASETGTVINPILVNAGGFNENDGLIYSIGFTNGLRNVLVITEVNNTGSGYEFTNRLVGPIPGIAPTTSFLAGDTFNNNLYLHTNFGNTIFEIDIDVTSPTYLTITNTITMSRSLAISDLVVEPNTGDIYAVTSGRSMFRIDSTNGNVQGVAALSYPASGSNSSFGAMFMDGDGLFYGIQNNTGIVYRVNLKDISPNTQVFSTSVPASVNDGCSCKNNKISIDYGDAPSSYSTLLVNNGARHLILNYDETNNTSSLLLGANVDSETDGFNSAAIGDDSDGINDDDALSPAPNVDINGTVHTITVPYVNTTGVDATIYAWIDFDQNGTFDDNEEFTSAIVSSGGTSASLTWSYPTDITLGTTYMRLRITSDTLTDTTSGGTDDRAFGPANDGEVEDYEVEIVDCSGIVPTVGAVTQPTCTTPTGSFQIIGFSLGDTYTFSPSVVNISSTGLVTANPGSYTFTVTDTDGSGCTSSSSAVIVVDLLPTTPAVPVATHVDPSCTVSTGSINVTSPIATSTYTLTGITPVVAAQTGISFTTLSPGTYELTETNADGCISVATTIVIDPALTTPAAPAATHVDPTCLVATGSINVTSPVATSTYTLTGITPVVAAQTGTSFTALAPGTYELTETNADGCISVATTIIIDPALTTPAAPAATHTDPTCVVVTGSINVTSPIATSTYTLTGITPVVAAQTGTIFTTLAPGTYELTETNVDGCISGATTIVIDSVLTTPAAPAATHTDPSCLVATGSINVTSPVVTSTYTLTGITPVVAAQTGTVFTTLSPGTYELTETNADGCISVATTIIIDPALTTPTAPVVTHTDPTCAVATGSITVTSPVATSTYTLTGITPVVAAQTGTIFTTLSPGTYELTETNADGCISVATTIVIDPALTTPTAPVVTHTDPTCAVATGSITVTSPVATSTYTLTGITPVVAAQTGTIFTTLSPGTYELTETNEDGCISVATTIVIDPALITPAAPVATHVDPTCAVATGSINVTSPVATSTYTLTGITPVIAAQTGISFTALAPGTYELTETNASGCVSAATTIVIDPALTTPAAPAATHTDPTCLVATGSINVTSPVVTSTYTLTGITPVVAAQTGTSFTTLASGTYELTETNEDGCISVATTIVIDPALTTPAAPVATHTDPTCLVATGSINVTSPIVTSTYTLTGITPVVAAQTGTSFTTLSPGTYELTETNADGCISVATTIVIDPALTTPAAPVATHTDPTCVVATGSINVTTPVATSTYTLTGITPVVAAQTGTSFTTLSPGTYELTETNADGCISVATTIVIDPALTTPTAPAATHVDPTCLVATGSINVSSPVATSTYTLTGITPVVAAQTGTSFTTLTPGTYELTETNADGCISAPTTIIIDPALTTPAAPAATHTDPTCVVVTGSINVTSPIATSTYTLTGITPVVAAQTGISFTALAPGTYELIETNVDGCISGATTIVIDSVLTTPAAPAATHTDPSCLVATGSINVTSPVVTSTYTLTGITPVVAAQTGTVFTTLSPGTYELTETNADGCISVATTIIIDPALTTPTAPVVTHTDPTCAVGTGSITVTSPIATSTYTLTGITPVVAAQTGISFTTLAPGTYELTETNASGCVSAATTIVIDPALTTPAAPAATHTDPTCAVATGSINVTSPVATSTYTLTGITPVVAAQTGTSFTTLSPGTYELTETNADGCISVAITIVIDSALTTPAAPAATHVDPTCLVATGSINVSSPVATSTYTLTGITPVVAAQTGTSFTTLSPGTYELTETNADGCISVATTIVIDPALTTPAAPAATHTDPTCVVATGSITVTSPVATSTYILTGITPVVAAQTGTSFITLVPGTYELTETNADGCISVATTIIIDPALTTPAAPVATHTDPTCTVATGSVNITSPVATSTYTLTGITPVVAAQTGTVFTTLSPGTYELTETNASGCISAATTIVIDPMLPVPRTPSAILTQPTCLVPSGTITFVTQPNVEYSIDGVNFQASEVFTSLSPNTYTLTVRNTTGSRCSTVGLFPVTIDAVPSSPPTPVLASVLQPTCSIPTGTIAFVSQPNVEYSIDGITFRTNEVFSNLPPNTYNLTVRSSIERNCVTTSSVPVVINSVPIPPTIPVLASVLQPTCSIPTGTIAFVSQPNVEYSIDGVTFQSSEVFANLSPNAYDLTVRSTVDTTCSTTSSVPVVINSVPIPPTIPVLASVLQPTCSIPTGTITFVSQPNVEYSIDGVTFQSSEVFANLSPNTYDLTVRSTVDTTCSTTSSVPVVINSVPIPPTVPVLASVLQPTCSTPTGTITFVSQPNVEYSIDGVTFQSSEVFANLSPNTYDLTVRSTVDTTCSTTSSVPVVINSVPIPPTVPVLASVLQPTCSTPTGTITFVSQPNVEYSIDGITFQSSEVFANLSPNTYDLTVRSIVDSTCSATSSVPVVINSVPSPPVINATVTIELSCTINTGEITISNPVGNNFEYSINGTTFQSSPIFSNLLPDTYQVTVRDITDITCISTTSLNIVAAPVVNLAITCPPSITLECGASLETTNTGLPTVIESCGEVTFTFTDSNLINGCSSNTGTFIRTFTATDERGDTVTCTQEIIIEDNTPPVFNTTIPPNLLVSCDSIPEIVTVKATDTCDDTVNITFSENRIDGTCSNRYLIERIWTATDVCGNTSTFTQELNVFCPIKVYNGVSFNNDGSNDIFLLEGIECYANNTVKIFNRWGVLVFETENYDNVNNVFRGVSDGRLTIARNEKLPTGTYFYIIKYDFPNNGNLEVLTKSGYLYIND
ncbi:GEVED domain-containing protein [uncultured Tenacibaculum sp.]|uniref:GEVED domain-containing protein n=1 Tax=uncultured Tenacibaculum sp. TaxID=174713 RepID=UPI0026332C17|nr:GEVED domain-containing protein [uncultured Tenacibaculum sp.]